MAPQTLFLNLHTTNLDAATTFYTSLGLTKNSTFSDDQTACFTYTSTIFFMVHSTDRFRSFSAPNREIVDAKRATEVLISLTVDNIEQVDKMVDRAVKAGGKPDPNTLPQVEGMKCRSFEDLDGHIWQVAYMDMGGCGGQDTAAV